MIPDVKGSPPQLLIPNRKVFATFLFVVFAFDANCQELVSREYEKGYLKDGKKISVWEYYNHKKELELKINHSSGRIYFLKKDTSDYVIFKDGVWAEQKLEIYPIPAEGSNNFIERIASKIRYPMEARERAIEGEVIVIFEVDTSGMAGNYQIWQNIGHGCGDAVMAAMKEADVGWVPAMIAGRPYSSRFSFSVVFSLQDGFVPSPPSSTPPLAAKLSKLHIEMFGGGFPPMSGQIRVAHYRSKRYYSLKTAIDSKERVEYLSLANFGLTALPEDLVKLKYLVHLDVEKNSLTEIDRLVGKLEKLERLYAPLNKLDKLPEELSLLPRLKIISLAGNQFTEFPEQLCSCLELEALDLGENKISTIPPCINRLKKLRMIVLNGNRLQSLPNEFYDLTKLEAIFLKKNPLDLKTIQRIKSTFKEDRIVWE